MQASTPAGTGPQLYLINHRDELFLHGEMPEHRSSVRIPPDGELEHRTSLAQPTWCSSRPRRSRRKSRVVGNRGYPWVPGVIRGLTVPAGFARTASQADLASDRIADRWQRLRDGAQLPGKGHYDELRTRR